MNVLQFFQKENIFGNKFILLTISLILLLASCSDNSTEPENTIELKSTPQEIVWERTGLTNESIRYIVMNSNGDIFAGSLAKGNFPNRIAGAVFRSKDDGDTWMKHTFPLVDMGCCTLGDISTLVINSKGHIFAGTTGGGIFRTIDSGDSWAQIDSLNIRGRVNTLAINSDDIIVGGDNGRVYRSTDDGDTFTDICLADTLSGVDQIAINSMGHIFMVTENHGFHRSTDNGETCPEINDFYFLALDINSTDDIFAGWFGGVYRSTDNGDSWVQTSFTQGLVLSIALNSKDDEIFAAGADYFDLIGGAFRSNDNGDNWTEIVSGLTSTNVLSIAVSPSGRLFAGVDTLGIFRSKE